jgi:hypothetical protein
MVLYILKSHFKKHGKVFILSFINSNSETSSVLESECCFKVSNGRAIHFWIDNWLKCGFEGVNFHGFMLCLLHHLVVWLTWESM